MDSSVEETRSHHGVVCVHMLSVLESLALDELLDAAASASPTSRRLVPSWVLSNMASLASLG